MFSDIKILGVVDVNGSNPIIEFKDVSFQYQSDAAFTLNRVSFSIPAGQWTSIEVTMVQENLLLLNLW